MIIKSLNLQTKKKLNMYAIVEIAGQQFKVAKDQKLFVHRLNEKEGSNISFDKVYLLDDGKKVTIGAPAIAGTSVQAKVIKHLKGEKVIVFKKKRRKGYRVKNGHRQYLTELFIESIGKIVLKNDSKAKDIEEKPNKESSKKIVAKKESSKKVVAKKESSKKVVAKKEPAKKVVAKKDLAKKKSSKK